MHPRLLQLFDSLEADRHRLLEMVGAVSPEKLHRAEPGKWSVTQILAHLIAAEKLSRLYMNKKILGIAETADTSVVEEIKMALLKLSQRLPFKFKAPRTVIENTPVYPDLYLLRADWGKERAELRALLEKFDDTQIKRKIYRHIRAGRLNVQHALIFFREHHRHHWPQIRRRL